MEYFVRETRNDDIEELNNLYLSLTGIKRTISQYQWQWQNAPAGRGDSWVIVEKSNSKIIGHHGIMPYFFSNQGESLLVGKTENTMVLKEYRHKLSYPKIEMELFKKYSKKYSIIFTSMAPSTVIRMRSGLGYDLSHTWQRHDLVLKNNYYFKLLQNMFGSKLNTINQDHKDKFCNIINLSEKKLEKSIFINSLWNKVSRSYGVTPRRYWEDLKWRFFDNPYFVGSILLLKEEFLEGYAVINKKESGIYQLEDFIINPANVEKSVFFLKKIISYLIKNTKVEMLRIQITDDNELLSKTIRNLGIGFSSYPLLILRKFKKKQNIKRNMPRILCKNNQLKKNTLHGWYTTPFLFEGR